MFLCHKPLQIITIMSDDAVIEFDFSKGKYL